MKEFEGKRLLLLGGVKTACAIVEKAQEMGAYVIVADYNTDSPAKLISDEAILIKPNKKIEKDINIEDYLRLY